MLNGHYLGVKLLSKGSDTGIFRGFTWVLQGRYRGGTDVLQWSYRSISGLLQDHLSCVKAVLKGWCRGFKRSVTGVLHMLYKGVIWGYRSVMGCYSRVTGYFSWALHVLPHNFFGTFFVISGYIYVDSQGFKCNFLVLASWFLAIASNFPSTYLLLFSIYFWYLPSNCQVLSGTLYTL